MATQFVFLSLAVCFVLRSVGGQNGYSIPNSGYNQYPPAGSQQQGSTFGNNQNYPGGGSNTQPGVNNPWVQQSQQDPYGQQPQQQQGQQQAGNRPPPNNQPSNSYNPQGSFAEPQAGIARVQNGTPLRFCTVSNDEQFYCLKMVFELGANNMRSADPPNMGAPRGKRQASTIRWSCSCVQAVDKLECMNWIAIGKADVVQATAGEAYIGGKDHSLVPIALEAIGPDRNHFEDLIVAVVRADRGMESTSQFRGKKACFGPVGDVTWDHVMAYLRTTTQITPPRTCEENDMDSIVRYFTDICAPYDKTNFTDAENSKYVKMCSLCGGQNCPNNLQQIQADYSLNCLLQNNQADVAFMRASVLSQALRLSILPEPHLYQVICTAGVVALGRTSPSQNQNQNQNGNLRSLQEWPECYVGRIPTNAFITRSSSDPTLFAEMSRKLSDIFSFGGGLNPNQQRPQWMDNFFTGRYDDNQKVTGLTTYLQLQNANMDDHLIGFKPYIEDRVACTAQERVKWCTTSKADQEKCEVMKKAFKANRLRPELECEAPVKNAYACLDKIQRNQTGLAIIDIGDLATAGNYFQAIQLAQERYISQDQYGNSIQSIMDEPYAVAVVKDAGLRQLSDLRGKRACFSGLWEAHGFMLPMQKLREVGLVNGGTCQQLDLAQNFFGDSCLPGLSDGEMNTQNAPKEQLCKQCEGGERTCTRSRDTNRYAGALGALKCLKDGRGDVAFLSHTALAEIPMEERQMYMLICQSGTNPLDSYVSCNMGQAPGSVIVTNRYKSVQEKRRLTEMLLGASRLFSADMAAQYNQNSRSSLASFSPAGLERSRKTHHMFGKRNKTETSQFGAPGMIQSSPFQTGFTPSASSNFASDWTLRGEYALFGVGAYDLRGFGDINTTHIGEALGQQSYRILAERSEWRRCYETGSGSRFSSVIGVVFLSVIGIIGRVFLL